MPATAFPREWARKCAANLHTALSSIVFLFLDFLEALMCAIYRCLDEFFEGNPPHCYCEKRREQENGEEENEVSETLYGRENAFRKMGVLGFARKWEGFQKTGGGGRRLLKNRWSDCGCESCVSWMKNGEKKLHVVVREPSQATMNDSRGNPMENVIFLHGFISSSSIWTEPVFPRLSESVEGNYRLIAVDLLGFGKSPKPRDCLYTLSEHLDMLEKSVISPLDLNSFHLVAHSMGCTIALAVAAKYPRFVKSLTLVAPPYLWPSKDEEASFTALNKFAERRLWPPLLFASSFMSWYEHLGRCVCFVICCNHTTWESMLKLLTQRRDLHFMIMDLTKHTHHSAWHSMHNVICGGAKYADDYLNALIKHGIKLSVIQGDQDEVIPLECSMNIKMKVPDAEVCIVSNAGHMTVILGREKEFTQSLERIWTAAAVAAASFFSFSLGCLSQLFFALSLSTTMMTSLSSYPFLLNSVSSHSLVAGLSVLSSLFSLPHSLFLSFFISFSPLQLEFVIIFFGAGRCYFLKRDIFFLSQT